MMRDQSGLKSWPKVEQSWLGRSLPAWVFESATCGRRLWIRKKRMVARSCSTSSFTYKLMGKKTKRAAGIMRAYEASRMIHQNIGKKRSNVDAKKRKTTILMTI